MGSPLARLLTFILIFNTGCFHVQFLDPPVSLHPKLDSPAYKWLDTYLTAKITLQHRSLAKAVPIVTSGSDRAAKLAAPWTPPGPPPFSPATTTLDASDDSRVEDDKGKKTPDPFDQFESSGEEDAAFCPLSHFDEPSDFENVDSSTTSPTPTVEKVKESVQRFLHSKCLQQEGRDPEQVIPIGAIRTVGETEVEHRSHRRTIKRLKHINSDDVKTSQRGQPSRSSRH